MAFPTPAQATSKEDVRAFFNEFAAENYERHGEPDELLAHRLNVLDRHAHFGAHDTVLDVGCGDGSHLRALSDRVGRGIGVDFAPRMIDVARRQTNDPSLSFRVDDAEDLATIPESSVDVVISVGVLEHVLRPARVLRQVRRVLTDDGRFVALTLNGTYWWYRLADRLRIPTRHLTTDRRLNPEQARRLLQNCGLEPQVGFWRFVPSGDLPTSLAVFCETLETVGEWASSAALRGGLRLAGRRPRRRRTRRRERDGAVPAVVA